MKGSGCKTSNKIQGILVYLTVASIWGFAPRLHYPHPRWSNDFRRLAPPISKVSAAVTTTTTDRSNDSSSTNSKTKEERFVEWMTTDCWDEVPHPGIQLSVQGHIPSYVQGTYIKNGPGAFATRDPSSSSRRYTHAFDGLAKLQKFAIDGSQGTVTFTTRYIESKIQRGMMQENRIPGHLSVGPVEPPFAWWDIVWHTLDFDNTCVNFEQLSQSNVFCAVTDAVVRNQINPETLETVGRLPPPSIQGLTGITQFSTAHSKIAHRDGCTYNYYLEFGLDQNYAHMVRTNQDLTQTSIGKVPLTNMGRMKFPYVHEISVSENYAILVLHPLLVNLPSVLQKGYLLPTLEYTTTQNTQIVLFDLHQVQPVQIFEAPPCWCYHHANAYEETNTATGQPVVVLDLMAYERADITTGPHGYLYPDNMRTPQGRQRQEREGTLWRYRLDVSSSSWSETAATHRRWVQPERKPMHDPGTGLPLTLELVSVAPDRLGRPYRYLYGFTGFHQGRAGYMDWAILKQDVERSERHGVWYQEYMYPGEVTFVPNPDSSSSSISSSSDTHPAEDDGVLLSTVFDSLRGENFLLVLDASNMKELARAYTGVAFPQSFHGKFYPTEKAS